MLILHAIIKNTVANIDKVKGTKLPFKITVEPCGDLAAITSNSPDVDDSVFADADRLAAFASQHNALLVMLSAELDLVPVRLGVAYTNAQSIVSFVNAEEAMFARVLAHVADAVEVTLHIEDLKPSERETIALPAEVSGRDYLKARSHAKKIIRNRSELRHDLMRDLTEGLAPFTRANSKPEPKKNELAMLVARADLNGFLEAISAFENQAKHDGFAIKAVGPWPPYSFVEEAA
jgi:hypothetical protein